MANSELWERLYKTDPKQVKAITGKQYKGNSPKPYYLIQKANEVFGDCGIGWGVNVVNERFERLTDTDVLHIALVRVWYIWKDKRGEIEQMGQTKAAYKTSKGEMLVDEDAPKKSVTDGMVKALSMIGFAGDIFSGRWDDNKYLQELNAEFREPQQKPTANQDADGLWNNALSAVKTAPDMASLQKHFVAAQSLISTNTEKTQLVLAKDVRKEQLTAMANEATL
jgi:hypothetical protein